jgi:hypothetical protein
MVGKKNEEMSIYKSVLELGTLDAESLEYSEKSYGDSWKKRGGIGAFMMLARKWDRIENQVKKYNYDIFEALHADPSNEGIIDDIWDLRRYLFLIEDEIRNQLGGVPLQGEGRRAQESFNFRGSNPPVDAVEDTQLGNTGTDFLEKEDH